MAILTVSVTLSTESHQRELINKSFTTNCVNAVFKDYSFNAKGSKR